MLSTVLLVCATLWTGSAIGQEETPQINPSSKKARSKKDKEPRAVAVLQMATNGKASLVPIAILIDGKFWDASAYKADPVPMALETGTVYEAERTGSSQGLFTVNTALHSNAANAPTPWLGTGSWAPAGAEKPESAPKAEGPPVGIGIDEARPRLTRNPAPANAPASKAPSTPASTPPSSTQPSGPRSDDEPPRLTKPASSNAPPASEQEAKPPQSDAKGNSSRENENDKSGSGPKTDKKTADQAAVPSSDSGADEANRPRLRRGKPAESFADEEIPGYSKPGAPAPKSAAKPDTAPSAGPVELIPAISDAGGPPPHSYVFQWLKDEEGERKQQILDLAKQQLRAYLDAQAKNRISSPPPAPRKTKVTKPPEPILENVKTVAYDLWNSNQPVIVFSADAHMPTPPPAAPGSFETDLQYSITIVAYPDMYGGLRKIYSGITDKYHLDITPRLELVDAVDADGDGRGELLFRAASDAGTGWRIYRATADTLWKMYDSLNPL